MVKLWLGNKDSNLNKRSQSPFCYLSSIIINLLKALDNPNTYLYITYIKRHTETSLFTGNSGNIVAISKH